MSVTCLQKDAAALPYYERAPAKAKDKKEKHYYMALTLGGHGVLACVAMRSGTKHVQDEEGMKYWFDRLVEFGIGTEVQQDSLRARTWVRTVSSSTLPCSVPD